MKYVIIILLTLAIFIACEERNTPEPETIIAKVDGEKLTLEDINASLGESNWKMMSKEEQSDFINQWVNLTVLANQAKRDEIIKNDKATRFAAMNTEKKIYANALIAKELESIKISDEELYKGYLARQSEFVETVREYRVQRIFLRDEEQMERITRLLASGNLTFTPAAQAYSQEGIGRNGGYMGTYVTKAGPDSTIWRALNDKQRYEIATTQYRDGWVIARYINHREGQANIDFYDVKDIIDAMLREEKRADVFDRVLKESRLFSNIEIQY